MYIYLTDQNTVAELIPDENPVFPGVPVEKRYAPDFAAKLLYVNDSTEVEQNWVYDPETGTFSAPPEPEPPEEPDPIDGAALLEQLSAAYTEGVESYG